MSAPIVDALGRQVELARPPRRVVSLVPSDTETVAALAGVDRLAGRTSYCEEPRGRIEAVPTVGGTKKHDVEAVLALRPDLVLANREENGRRDVERLIEAGVTVYVGLPTSVDEALAHLETLALLLDAGQDLAREARARVAALGPPTASIPVFVPIWRDPWMTFDARTYASDLLARAGGRNVFADRARRFPLAADLGEAEPEPRADRDTRYPRTSLAEVRRRGPARVLLPDEPYAFGPADVEALVAEGVTVPVEAVSGKDLFWFGVRTAPALERLRARLEA